MLSLTFFIPWNLTILLIERWRYALSYSYRLAAKASARASLDDFVNFFDIF